MSKKRRTFKMNRWPSRQEGNITHVYPAPSARTTQIAEQDQIRFMEHPNARAFIREYIPGEFAGVKLPDGMTVDQITHVYVQRIGEEHQARIPLTREQADMHFYGVQDALGLRTEFEKAAEGHPDDPFNLPDDIGRLNMAAAAAGMHSAFIDYPSFVDREETKRRALTACTVSRQAWPEMTNDYPLYRKTFVPAFLLGYNLGVEQINLADPDERDQAVQMVKSADSSAGVTASFFRIIQKRMGEVGAESIYDLIQE